MKKVLMALGLCLMVTGCASVYPLASVAKRASNPQALKQDIAVDTASREVGKVEKVGWAAYSVTFECSKDCPYTAGERARLAQEIADKSFLALDREIRKAFATSQSHSAKYVADVSSTLKTEAFRKEIKTDSYKSTISRWLDKLGLSRAVEVRATAQGLKYLDPSELGWSGEESLSALGRSMGWDGVLVGHLKVTVESQQKQDQTTPLKVKGPKVWIFSAAQSKAVTVAELRPYWKLEPQGGEHKLDWSGLDDVATGFSLRVAQAIEK